ncbi:phosphatase 2C-like domain-containing protein [Mycena filopes]|nr:phosphatase 2C-like domain-containing protein [Mycena filopes]
MSFAATAADWEAKPPWDDLPKPKRSFSPDNPIRLWREEITGQTIFAGEDFLLCSSMRHNSGVALCVADGVGGWIQSGIDSSMFSQALMYYAQQHFQNGWAGEPENDPTVETGTTTAPEGIQMLPSKVMELAHNAVLGEKTVEAGSSTACFVTLNASSGILQSANLGDSGFCIVRSSAMFYNSPPQTHFFNCPRQLAKTQGRGRSGSINDSPSSARVYSTRLIGTYLSLPLTFEIQTDGLADNIFPAEILKICGWIMNSVGSDETKAELLAQSLVYNARSCMFNGRVSPFELEARRHRKVYEGGVLALVRETP